jgi:hypothetical protein
MAKSAQWSPLSCFAPKIALSPRCLVCARPTSHSFGCGESRSCYGVLVLAPAETPESLVDAPTMEPYGGRIARGALQRRSKLLLASSNLNKSCRPSGWGLNFSAARGFIWSH